MSYIVEIDNESHTGERTYLDEEEAVEESMKKGCMVAYFLCFSLY